MARILLVEDTPANRVLATKLLRAAGHDVLTAGTGDEGVALARRHRLDLVLMDLGLPDMDGRRAMLMIRALELADDLPIVAFTAHAMVGDRERALTAGFDGYLSKPIDVATFATRVAEMMT
jgi:CheY-like chemotaxis protein